MIIDGFTFYNEFDMLECRLEYLYNYVDYFVISECDHSFSGKMKGFNYLSNQSRFKKYQSKILYAPLNVDPSRYNLDITKYTANQLIGTGSDFWQIERQQRNHIMSKLKWFQNDTIVLIGDLDEIPNVELFANLQEDVKKNQVVYFGQESCHFNLRTQHEGLWIRPFASTKSFIEQHSPDTIRLSHPNFVYDNGGWHLSYFMTPEQIKTKIESFSHQELNIPYWTDTNRIADCINNSIDLYERPATMRRINKESYPEHFMKVFNKFY